MEVRIVDLFSSAADDELARRGPLAARMRPATIDDVVGQEHLLGSAGPLRRMVESDRLQSLILWGPPGSGKTSIAAAISASSSSAFEQLSAVSAGVKDVREVIERARLNLGTSGRRTILFLDEIHRFSKSQQDALLPAVEDGSIVLIGATTENPSFNVNSALLSRSVLLRLEPLGDEAIRTLIQRGCEILERRIEDDAMEEILRRTGGDGRQALALLEIAATLADGDVVEASDVAAALGSSVLRYGIDDHYDVISAFIKSMRASDPQAAVLYLARMLASGEDPRFIARRMIIFASEDVGMADPQALTVSVAAGQALEFVGLPEAQLGLAECAIYLATAPKSKAVARAIWSARTDVESGKPVDVPTHLRDGHYSGAVALGHGVGYQEPLDAIEGGIRIPPSMGHNLSEEWRGTRWYVPSKSGFEAEIRSRMFFEESIADCENEVTGE